MKPENYRYRCTVCGQRWNVARGAPSPRRYICPHCEYKRQMRIVREIIRAKDSVEERCPGEELNIYVP